MPAQAGPEALQLFSHDLLQHMAIEREIRHQAFQLGILLTELPQFAQFTEAQPRILALPRVKRLLADAGPPTRPPRSCHPLLPAARPESVASVCPRRVLLLGQEDHVAGRSLKLPLAYFSGFGSQAHLGLTKGLTLNRTLRYYINEFGYVILFLTHRRSASETLT